MNGINVSVALRLWCMVAQKARLDCCVREDIHILSDYFFKLLNTYSILKTASY